MPLNRKPESLTIADLPGVDPARFDEWKRLHRRARMASLFGPLVYASTLITVPVIGGAIGWALPIAFWFVYMFAYVAPLAAAERKLAAELGVPAAIGLTAAEVARTERTVKVAKVVVLSLVGLIVLSIVVAVAMARGNRRTVGVGATDALLTEKYAVLTEKYAVLLTEYPGDFVGTRVPARYFEAAGATPHAGRFFVAADHESRAAPVVVISHSVWKTLYNGDYGVLGRAVQINGREATIIGIARPAFAMPGLTHFWTPVGGAR